MRPPRRFYGWTLVWTLVGTVTVAYGVIYALGITLRSTEGGLEPGPPAWIRRARDARSAIGLGRPRGHPQAPALRASESGRMWAMLLNLAASLTALVLDHRTTAALCLASNSVVVMVLWEGGGPRLRRRLRAGWRKWTAHFSRPVIPLPASS